MKKIAGSLAIAMAIAATTVAAHKGATGVTLERMQSMTALRDIVRDIAPIMQGLEPYDALRVSEAGYVISRHGGQSMLGLFPSGSNGGVTFAKPLIWQDWAEFKALAEDLHHYGKALSREAAMGLEPSLKTTATDKQAKIAPLASIEEQRSKQIAGLLGYLDQIEPPSVGNGLQRFNSGSDGPADLQGATNIFNKIGATCSACHARFRQGKG